MLVELFPVVGRNAIDKHVGIVCRVGNKGQDAAGGGFDGNECTLAVTKSLLSDFLKFGIQGQREIVAGNRGNALQTAQGTATSINFDFFIAGFAMEFEFVMLFKPTFADVIRSFVVGLHFRILDPLEIAVGDSPDVANGVRRNAVFGILAK